jgi:hypothetical protein
MQTLKDTSVLLIQKFYLCQCRSYDFRNGFSSITNPKAYDFRIRVLQQVCSLSSSNLFFVIKWQGKAKLGQWRWRKKLTESRKIKQHHIPQERDNQLEVYPSFHCERPLSCRLQNNKGIRKKCNLPQKIDLYIIQ